MDTYEIPSLVPTTELKDLFEEHTSGGRAYLFKAAFKTDPETGRYVDEDVQRLYLGFAIGFRLGKKTLPVKTPVDLAGKTLRLNLETPDGDARSLIHRFTSWVATETELVISSGVSIKDPLAKEAAESLEYALNELGKTVCLHEETHRAGAIWTICDQCERKWADDRNPFTPYREPPELTQAYSTLTKLKERS